MNLMNASQAAEKWGSTKRWVLFLCKSGRIPGAEQVGNMWLIPKSAEKPPDARIKSGNYVNWRKKGNLIKTQPLTDSDHGKG
jgi:hypothetical protein